MRALILGVGPLHVHHALFFSLILATPFLSLENWDNGRNPETQFKIWDVIRRCYKAAIDTNGVYSSAILVNIFKKKSVLKMTSFYFCVLEILLSNTLFRRLFSPF